MIRTRLFAALTLFALVPLACSDRDTAIYDPRVFEPIEVPALALGYDAYRDWARWPVLRIGQRTIMRSTFDRNGANHASDASHFLGRDDHGYVALDVAGTGVLSFVRTNHWHGSPWHYVVDDVETIVSETSTADPLHPALGSTFEPRASFPEPMAVTWATTRGADLSWIPIPFQRSVELAYGRTTYGTGYYIVAQVAEPGLDAKTPIQSWDRSAPPADVLALFARAGTDIAPTAGLEHREGTIDIDGRASLVDIAGPATLRALRLSVPTSEIAALENARLVVTWDDRTAPSIDAPMPLFFGTGTFANPENEERLVPALPVNVRFSPSGLELATYFPMPFAARARIEIVAPARVRGLAWEARWSATPPAKPYGLFHATHADHGVPTPGRDLVLADTEGLEGASDWCGTIVGTSIAFTDTPQLLSSLRTLEGDPRFFFDDSRTPQVQGTGTEEWGGGGDYWGGRTMALPLVGHPVGGSLYRFLLADAMPFGRRARLQLEHGGENESKEHYRSVVYWYGRPSACLVLADTIDVGNVDDELRHRWTAEGASDVRTITSRFELGIDHLADGTELIPTTTEDGREIATSSSFDLDIPPDNVGLLLRRTLDYGLADQTALIAIARMGTNGEPGPFVRAGTWLTAGSNRVLYANAKSEVGDDPGVVIVGERRLREDEFLVDASLTHGASRVRVRVTVVPHRPGAPPAWSELRWTAYAWRVPRD